MHCVKCSQVWVDEKGNCFYVGHCMIHGEFVDMEDNEPPACPECKKETEKPEMVEPKDLKALELFSVLSELEELAKITNRKTYKANSYVYKQGDRAKEMFAVNRGLVSLRGIKSGDELTIAFEVRERGDLFGAAWFMQSEKYTLHAVCLEETEVFAIHAAKLYELCETDSELGYRLMKKVAQLYFDRYEAAKKELGIPMACPA